MAPKHLHIETVAESRSRNSGDVCGDTFCCFRDTSATTVLLCDGLGHGVKANVAATLCQSRLEGLLKRGYSLRKAFESLVSTMEAARGTDSPYAVFTALKILNDGSATIMSYEMPGAILVGAGHAVLLPGRPIMSGRATVMEASCHLNTKEGILLVSDGVTQAGMGRRFAEGWTLGGVARMADRMLLEGRRPKELPRMVLDEVTSLDGEEPGDDATAVLAVCRPARTVTVLTGPPGDSVHDHAVATRLAQAEGPKVVCGGTTASVVAHALGTSVRENRYLRSLLCPPSQQIDGVDLVTEGTVTLNQVYNLLDVDPSEVDEDSGVTRLLSYLRRADMIHFLVGQAVNSSVAHVSFRQQGILPRSQIIPLMVKKLEAAGKLVVLEKV